MPSRVIRRFAYDRTTAALDVTFVTGRRYRYFMVPAYLAEGLAQAFSKGRFFNARIRDRFPVEELEPEAEAPTATAAERRGRSRSRAADRYDPPQP
jgi:hypothetical protein